VKATHLAAIVFALVVLVAAASSAAQTDNDADQPPRTNILGLVTQTPAVEPGATFIARLRVTGAPANASIQWRLHSRLQYRSDFQQSANGGNLHSVLATKTNISALPDISGTVAVIVPTRDASGTVPPSDPNGISLGEGVYPVEITLLDSSKTVLDSITTYLVRLPVRNDQPPIGVAVVLPMGGGLSLQPDGSQHLDPAIGAAMSTISSELNTHRDVPATLAFNPESIDALDSATRDQVASAAQARQTPVAPFVPVDSAAWLDANLGSELDREFDVGVQRIKTIANPDSSTYIADGGLSGDVARRLQTRGVHDIVVPEANVAPLDTRVFNRALAQPFLLDGVQGVTAMAADAGLAAHLTESDDPVLNANHLIADLAMIWYDDPPDTRSMVVDLRNNTIDNQSLHQFLDTLLAALEPGIVRVFTPQTLSTAFASVPLIGSRGESAGRGTPLVRKLTPAPAANLTSYAPHLRAAIGDVASYRTAVLPNNPRPDQYERQVLASGAKQLNDRDRNRYLDTTRAAVKSELDKIEAPQRQTINFTARDGVVSIAMRNTTGYPVNIVLALQADKLEFPDHPDGIVPVTLADEITHVSLNVKTRASGDSALDVSVMTPDQNVEIGSTTVTVRSTAFSGVGIVLMVGAGLFLLIWWSRHTIQERRARRREPKHAVGGNGATHESDTDTEHEQNDQRDPAPA
jgi:hypothetical protein